MSNAHRKAKQPEQVRAQLLDAATRLLSEHGAQSLTLDAVSAEVGVTKGGLQHHFPNKQALVEALFGHLANEFNNDVARHIAADPEPIGRSARAYLRACLQSTSVGNSNQKAMAQLALAFPELQPMWRASAEAELRADASETADPILLLVCRLAADGLWFSQLSNYYPLSSERLDEIVAVLVNLSKKDSL